MKSRSYNSEDEEIVLNITRILTVLRKKLILFIVFGLIGAFLAKTCTNYFIDDVYESTTSIMVITKEDKSRNVNAANSALANLQFGTSLTQDYIEVILSRSVLEGVIDNLKLKDLDYDKFLKKVKVSNTENTRILKITVQDTDPERAKEIADEIAKVGSKYIKKLLDVNAPRVIDKANTPKKPISPNVRVNMLIGFAIGFVLLMMIVVIKELADDTFKTEEEIEKYLNVPTLAIIPKKAVSKKEKE